MKRFTEAGRQSIAAGNLYGGLSLALTLPDICASLEDPGPNKSRKRYERWCTEWIQPKYTKIIGLERRTVVFLSATDCFQLRCSLIHSGSAEVESAKAGSVNQFEFVDDSVSSHCNRAQTSTGVTILQLKASRFSIDVFDAVDAWDDAKVGVASVQNEKAKLLTIWSRTSWISHSSD
ncbi:hypothetical protein [Mesorhizobium sp. M0701]|uniref:hypothetical protein n=1 Tax=Mesorhizobium sp. M0701 TaxID=2956989 RepID=UPI003336A51B